MVWCPLSSLQIRLYRLLRWQLCDKSKSSSTGARRLPFSLNNMLMQYRKVRYLLLPEFISCHFNSLTWIGAPSTALQPSVPAFGRHCVGRR
eukprot:20609-Eustigmatos_ZCMA.PRE.1